MKTYSSWTDLFCPYCEKELVLLKHGKWYCENFPECLVHEENNLTLCEGYKKECSNTVIASNGFFISKEDVYCENCYQEYLNDRNDEFNDFKFLIPCLDIDCDGIIENIDGINICTSCGLIQDSESEIQEKNFVNRMKIILSGREA